MQLPPFCLSDVGFFSYSTHPRDIACDDTYVLYVLSLGAGDCSLQQVRSWGVRIGQSTADLHLLVLWVLKNSLASVGERKKKRLFHPSRTHCIHQGKERHLWEQMLHLSACGPLERVDVAGIIITEISLLGMGK